MLPHEPSLTPASDEQRILNVIAAQQRLKEERALYPPLSARVAARMLGARLDRALIEGVDPSGSPRLAARAALLTSRCTRSELADGLDVALARAQRPPNRTRALPLHSSVLANAPLIRELAAMLRGPAPLYAAGIARLHRLLTDGTGPMYRSSDGRALERELREARTAVTC
ncbi:MAG TPA: hypothetical protein VNZ05_09360 [Solirubrobacteraceae bacterium]|jgi:hypothetical protein|nr:hypothetical protein [Solirubrobacteraceae bacterium]